MKRLPYTGLIFLLLIGVILVIPAAFFGLCALFDIRLRTPPNDPHQFALMYENAPEGTVRIEPLIHFNDDQISILEVDQDSGLARLNDNGYVSLSLYYGHCECSPSEVWFTGGVTPEELQKQLGAFGAAYVDENGNVLGVTAPARYVYGSSKPRALKADGDKLTFCTGEPAHWQMTAMLVVAAVELLACFALAVIAAMAVANAVVEAVSRHKRV